MHYYSWKFEGLKIIAMHDDGEHHFRLPCLYVQQLLTYVAPPCKSDSFVETAINITIITMKVNV